MRRTTAFAAMMIFSLAFFLGAFYSALMFAPGVFAVPPAVDVLAPTEVTTSSATLEADINPQGKATSYRFEVGPANCSINPCPTVEEGELLAGTSPVRVKAELSGLTPGTTYHYRVVALSAEGEIQSPDRIVTTYLPPQVFGACPNDGLRISNPAAARIEHSSASLPDCRAYERATPRDKNAGDVTGTVPFARASSTGDAIGFISTTGVPGGVGSQEFPSYVARRGGSSWATEGTLPPGSAGQTAQVMGWTPDFSAVFSKATLFGEPLTTTFLMTPAGQAPITVVNYITELAPQFAAASQGAAQVLFESRVAIPGVTGAKAGKPNLYLYDKASGKLFLAGIQNDGQAPTAGAFAGSYDWIAGIPAGLSEGGASRSYFTQDQQVISRDGDAVYFTAGATGQLYARQNPTATQSDVDSNDKCTESGLACTVHVSASQKTNGIGPNGTDSGGTRPAAFMGASTDGSVALFTSSEKLTNDANTGPEQEPAAIERADIGGANVKPDCLLVRAEDVEVNATHVYWINSETEAIERAALPDCKDPEAFITPDDTDNPRGIWIEGDQIYWANAAKEAGGGTIGEAKIGASAAEEVDPDFIADAGNPHDVVVQGGLLYWTNSAMPPDEAYIGRAKAADGGEADLEFVTVFGSEPRVWGIAADAEHLYFVVRNIFGVSRIHRVGLDGDPDSYLVEFLFLDVAAEAKDVAVQGDRIYWSTQANNLLGRAKLNGTADPTEVQLDWIKEADHPQGIAVNPTHVYWSSNGESVPNPGNDLYRYEDGTLEDISVDSTSFAGADVQGVLGTSADGAYVYYVANGVPDDLTNSPNGRGEEAAPGDCNGEVGVGSDGTCNLYLWHAGTSSFIARLDVSGNEVQSDVANWALKTTGIFSNDFSFQKTARVTPDGQTLLFRSQRQLTGYGNEGISQFYRYQAGDSGPTCVSCNLAQMVPTGNGPDLGQVFPAVVAPSGPLPTLSRNLSATGNRVFFETTDALVAEDTNGQGGCPFTGAKLQSFPACLDVYMWEALGTGSCTDPARAIAEGGCLYLLSTGKETGPALIADVDESGNNVFFYTRARLVGDDEDQLFDVYDARVGGGLGAQNQPPSQSCLQEACKPPSTSGPTIAPAPQFSGPGNPPSKKPVCKKPKRKVKGRCVAKRKVHKGKKGNKQAAKRRVAATGRQGR